MPDNIRFFTQDELNQGRPLFSRDAATGRLSGAGVERMDTYETQYIERALTEVENERINTLYDPVEGLEICPIVPDLQLGVEYVEFRTRTMAGAADFVDTTTTNVPQISCGEEPDKFRVRMIAVGFEVNIQQMAAAAMQGQNIETDLGVDCEEALRTKASDTICYGDKKVGFYGIFRPSDKGGPKGKTYAAITTSSDDATDLNTMNGAANAVAQNSKGNLRPDMLALSDETLDILANKPRTEYVDRTVLEHFEAANRYFKNGQGMVNGFVALRDDNQTNSLVHGLCYKKDPRVVKCRIKPPTFHKIIELPFGIFVIYYMLMTDVMWMRPLGGHAIKLKTS